MIKTDKLVTKHVEKNLSEFLHLDLATIYPGQSHSEETLPFFEFSRNLTRKYIANVVRIANEQRFRVDFVRSGLIRAAIPDDNKIDEACKEFAIISKNMQLDFADRSATLLYEDDVDAELLSGALPIAKSLEGGADDLDVRVARLDGSVITEDEEKHFGDMVWMDTAKLLFAEYVNEQNVIEWEDGLQTKVKYWAIELGNGMRAQLSFGGFATNNKIIGGEFAIFQTFKGADGKNTEKRLFVSHCGFHTNSIEAIDHDKRGGSRVSTRAQVSAQLTQINEELYLDKNDVENTRRTMFSSDNVKQLSINRFDFLDDLEKRMREIRINLLTGMNKLLGMNDLQREKDIDSEIILKIFTTNALNLHTKVFRVARKLFNENGYDAGKLKSVFIKEALVQMKEPFGALIISLFTDYLRIFPFFTNAPVYAFYDLLTTDAAIFQTTQNTEDSGQVLLPLYRRNWQAILHNWRLSKKSDFTGLKTFWKMLTHEARKTGHTLPTSKNFAHLTYKRPGVFAFNPDYTYDQFQEMSHQPSVNYARLFRTKGIIAREKINANNETLYKYFNATISALSALIDSPNKCSIIRLDQLEIVVNGDKFISTIPSTLLSEISRRLYASGLLSPIGRREDYICTYTPPTIINSLYEEKSENVSKLAIRNLEERVLNVIREYSDRSRIVQKLRTYNSQPLSMAKVISASYYPKLMQYYVSPEAYFYYPVSDAQILIDLNL
ncbi:MAG: hypothetical protein Q7R95_09400 [bacterium]|nr:hypothetical protein [bacterium]